MIKEYHFSATTVTQTLSILKQERKDLLERIILATINDWTVLSFITDPKQQIYLAKFIVDELSEAEIKSLFLCKDPNGYTILHKLAKTGNVLMVQNFLKLLAENLGNKFLADLMDLKTNERKNILHIISTKYITDDAAIVNILSLLFNYLNQNLTEILEARSKEQYNFLLYCGEYQSLPQIINILNWMLNNISHTEIKDMLKAKNKNKQNFAQIIAQNKNPVEVLMIFNSEFQDYLTFDKLVCSQDSKNNNLVHYLIQYRIEDFWKIIQVDDPFSKSIGKAFLMPGEANKRILEMIDGDMETFLLSIARISDRLGKDFAIKAICQQSNRKATN